MFRIFALLVAFAFAASAAVSPGIDVLAGRDFDALRGKRVGLITNQTGVNAAGTKTRLILKKAPGVQLVALFAPEHGLDGTVGAAKSIATRKDAATGLTVFSIYGATRKPTPEMLRGLDALVFDMQDIGIRSYTYISTMARAMEAAGEADIEFIVLDRPNPLGGERVEGPGIEEKWRSFVGQMPTPYLHGMTAGELARMCNAKGWMAKRCKLTVVPMSGWSRGMTWEDTGLRWVQTSPNIPRISSVAGYAATSIFGSLEGSGFDVGIGTDAPFQMGGLCNCDGGRFTSRVCEGGVPASPYSREDMAGARLNISAKSKVNLTGINIHLIAAAQAAKPGIFNRYRDADAIFWKIYGSESLRSQIERGVSPATIIAGWQRGVDSFRSARQPYLIYQ